MPVYYVVESKMINPESYQQYIAQARPIIAHYGGRYLAVSGDVLPLDGGWTPERIVIIEFPSEDHVQQWLNSPEYRAIVPLREAGVAVRAVLVPGFDTH
ncbi:MAG: DUF1330 domain-containing protein [Chloroflexi bacterium]|nr:DUF1330 domain-containing protein [Chloroflexota bacterium]